MIFAKLGKEALGLDSKANIANLLIIYSWVVNLYVYISYKFICLSKHLVDVLHRLPSVVFDLNSRHVINSVS